MKRLAISLLIAPVLTGWTAMCWSSSCCSASDASPVPEKSAASCSASPRAMASFGVTGMTCPACAASIETALRALKGVQAADVSFENAVAVVTFDPTQIESEALIAAVQSAGGTKHQFDVGELPEPAGSEADRSAIPAEHLSFYSVPLVCQAAPEIGCGSRAKPILLGMGTKPEVSRAWLNRPGTILAIHWTAGTPVEKRAEIAGAIFKQHGIKVEEMTGDGRTRTLKDFGSDALWYGSEALDRLSEEEATVIATRLVNRLKAKVTLTDETAGKLRTAIAGVFRERFTGLEAEKQARDVEDPQDDILRVAASVVGESELALLKEAMALGFRPVAGEN